MVQASSVQMQQLILGFYAQTKQQQDNAAIKTTAFSVLFTRAHSRALYACFQQWIADLGCGLTLGSFKDFKSSCEEMRTTFTWPVKERPQAKAAEVADCYKVAAEAACPVNTPLDSWPSEMWAKGLRMVCWSGVVSYSTEHGFKVDKDDYPEHFWLIFSVGVELMLKVSWKFQS
jgi:hypothetical protein